MKTVPVRIGSVEYPIVIGSGARMELAGLLHSIGRGVRTVILADATVASLHGAALRACVPNLLAWHDLPPGESTKSLDQAAEAYDLLASLRFERSDVLVSFGGGVAGDLTGFIAATWLRGVRFVQVPTTLEAAIDASIGGKTGVNHAGGKNLIGAFHQPVAVIADTEFLSTLESRDWGAGLAESVKHAVIRDAAFFDWHVAHATEIRGRDPCIVDELIERNCRIKASVVAEDERELGLRAILNLGHTIGHGIEHACGHLLRHGECVALGMIAENEIARRRGLLTADDAARVRDLLASLGLPVRMAIRVDCGAVSAACRMDKKNRGGAIRAVLATGIGSTVQVDLTEEEIAASLPAIGAG